MPALIELGRFYERQQRWDDAQKQFQAAITAYPQDPGPRTMLARLYLNHGQKDMAEQVLRDASATITKNPMGYRMLGDFYLGQGETDKAAPEFARLHTQYPKDIGVTKTYIEILFLQNHLDDATKLNDAILKNSPSDSDSLVFRGEILTREGKANEAVPVLESAVKNAPDSALAHYHLGTAYAAVSNFGQAQSEWQQAARLRPNMAEPQRMLAGFALRKGDASLLTASSEQLIRIEPQSPEGYIFHSAIRNEPRS